MVRVLFDSQGSGCSIVRSIVQECQELVGGGKLHTLLVYYIIVKSRNLAINYNDVFQAQVNGLLLNTRTSYIV